MLRFDHEKCLNINVGIPDVVGVQKKNLIFSEWFTVLETFKSKRKNSIFLVSFKSETVWPYLHTPVFKFRVHLQGLVNNY